MVLLVLLRFVVSQLGSCFIEFVRITEVFSWLGLVWDELLRSARMRRRTYSHTGGVELMMGCYFCIFTKILTHSPFALISIPKIVSSGHKVPSFIVKPPKPQPTSSMVGQTVQLSFSLSGWFG